MGFTVHTKLLAEGESFLLTEAYNCQFFSFQVSSGSGDTASYIGSAKNPVTGQDSVACFVPAGGGQVFVSDNPQKNVSGITVTAVQGSVSINIGY